MDVMMGLQNWKVQKDDKSGMSKLVGKYELIFNGKVIASQEFNGGYGSSEIPFSGELMSKVKSVEDELISELKKMLG